MRYPRLPALAAAVFLAGASILSAVETKPAYPPQTIPGSQIRVLAPSAVANGREYQLFVSLPSEYDANPEKRYPVMYLCDGYWDFNLVCGFKGNLIFDKTLPEIIVVGFGYAGGNPDVQNLRTYDYTPGPAADDRGALASGHAREFLNAIEKEIIPFVEKEYRADPAYRVLGGSSLGGLFTLYALFEKPGLFQAYIAPSPACGWADDWLFAHEERFANSAAPLKARLYLTAAEKEWPVFRDNILRFHERLAGRSYEGFTYKFRLIDDEYHAGTKAESYNRGVRFAFEPLVPKP